VIHQRELNQIAPRSSRIVDVLEIHSGEVVLEYVLGEPRSYCIRVTRANARIVMLSEGRRAIEQAIDGYLAEVLAGKACR
jgi:hypothetical protein